MSDEIDKKRITVSDMRFLSYVDGLRLLDKQIYEYIRQISSIV
jgi:hypothetical protein